MNVRYALTFVAVFLLGVLTTAAVLGRPAFAEPKADAAAVGRYQIIHLTGNDVVVLDTATGQCWDSSTAIPQKWENMGSPR